VSATELCLRPPSFRPLPLGAIRPQGWLARQLRIQAGGLSGHLDEVWSDIRDSRWFGGDAEGWERAPYWLDGLIPLAYLLDDAGLKAKATRYMDYILSHQEEDGWLGPRTMVAAGGRPESAHYDLWAQLLVTKVLAQYHNASSDPRALDALVSNLRMLDRRIDRGPLFNWAQFRWFEALIGLYYAYEREPELWMLDLAVKLHAQGFHWGDFFRRWPLSDPTPRGRWNYMGHVVNNAMAVKAHGLWYRLSGDEQDKKAVCAMIEALDRHHGSVTGMFSGDECLAGRRPTQGTELCAVVEYAYSLEVLLSCLRDAYLGDRLEQIAYNALPATFSPDMWSHQYDQQVNQVECSIRDDWPWTTNGPESNIYGLEPNYGCCTANLSQGWPKFAAHLWMEDTQEFGGLAAVAYAPCQARATLQGVPVVAEMETGYPFRETVQLRITTESPVWFPIQLRIPQWATDARVQVSGEAATAARSGVYYGLFREWRDTTEITLTLPMTTRLVQGHNGAVAVQRGPLTYSLSIGEEWRRVHKGRPHRELAHGDWEVYPTTPWNYALDVSRDRLRDDVRVVEHRIGDRPFSPDGAPVSLLVRGRRIPGWGQERGSAADAPQSPVNSEEPLEMLTLIPYGCTNLRLTEFPVLGRTRDPDPTEQTG
jgi:hypothetical protein